MKEAMFFERVEDDAVRCGLCRFNCHIAAGSRGICAVRENRDGILYSLNYGSICAAHVDPIEKKPLFHVMPGSRSYSIAAPGCNFRCLHCQNYSISQVARTSPVSGHGMSPREAVRQALANDCRSISYTYTEPTVYFEFAYETACLAKEAGLKNIFVTNGYISKAALTAIAPFLDAANIDVKGFSKNFYRDVVHANLPEVLDSIMEYRAHGVWIELTTLIIPGRNDSDAELRDIAEFMTANLGVDTPWHVTRFYPTYKMTGNPATPLETLRKARDIGRAAGLRYVYEGNVPGENGENTLCPACNILLIKRRGFMLEEYNLLNGKCTGCGEPIAGIGM